MQIVMNGFGEYLGVDRKGQRFVVFKDGKRLGEYPFHLVKQVQISPRNNLSFSALFWASMYGINVVVVSNTGRPLSMLLPVSCDAHAKTLLLVKVKNQVRLLSAGWVPSRKRPPGSHKLRPLR